MRIRSILLSVFVVVTLVPSAIFGLLSYKDGVEREFHEVNDTHLLLARSLRISLERYRIDLVAALDTMASGMIIGRRQTNLEQQMRRLNINCVIIIDVKTGKILSRLNRPLMDHGSSLNFKKIKELGKQALRTRTTFSTVHAGKNGANNIYAIRLIEDKLMISEVDTGFFVELGKTISFGRRGHAAIVDQAGNVLAHPLPSWVAARKNIAKVSAVQRMMKGETGVEQFYSPALKGDMIAGLTTVPEAGWGIMIPQPVEEIYEKVYSSVLASFYALIAGLSVAFIFVIMLMHWLVSPLEGLVKTMNGNARRRDLKLANLTARSFPVKELKDLQTSFNLMVRRVNKSNDKIKTQAYTDSVTGLPNREKFQQTLDSVLADESQLKLGGSMVFVDLDNFKEVNDVHGHDVGDLVLQECAAALKRVSMEHHIETADKIGVGAPVVCRMGGDEFTILLPGLVKDDEVLAFLDEVRSSIASPSKDVGYLTACSASIGCARYPKDGNKAEQLFKRSDIAMYQAKLAGRNCAQLFTPTIGTKTEAEIRHNVQMAIANDEMTLEYQPKVNATTRQVEGVEALIRWHDPIDGYQSPADWIPAISNSGVIVQLGEFVVERALHDHKKWCEAGFELKLAINIGSKHFVSAGFVTMLNEKTDAYSLNRSLVEIEVTEDTLFGLADLAEATVQELHVAGYSISIDDYGTGYSNISRLAKLPVDYLKLDRSIVVGALENERIRTILASATNMAKELGCKTVAEGVETIEQVEFATEIGVDLLQGFYFAKSMKPADLLDWMGEQNANPVHVQHELLAAAVA